MSGQQGTSHRSLGTGIPGLGPAHKGSKPWLPYLKNEDNSYLLGQGGSEIIMQRALHNAWPVAAAQLKKEAMIVYSHFLGQHSGSSYPGEMLHETLKSKNGRRKTQQVEFSQL